MSRKWKWRLYSIILFLLTLPYLFLNVSLLIKSADHDQVKPQLIKEFDPQLDLLVFFHIQKTSGTHFGNLLVQNLEIKSDSNIKGYIRACRETFDAEYDHDVKRYRQRYRTKCQRDTTNQSWLLTWQEDRFGWKCGLHPDLTDLKECVNASWVKNTQNRRVEYITFLREPVSRYLSEYNHVYKTGSTWMFEQEALTDGQKCAKAFYGRCLGHKINWKLVSLEDFVFCPYSLARNRQTRMLAQFDSEFTLCEYLNHSLSGSMDEELLARAKRNLDSMAFFGLTEYQDLSRVLFEKTFNGTFKLDKDERTSRIHLQKHKSSPRAELAKRAFSQRIIELNNLDSKLYKYALQVFFNRLKAFNITV